MWLYSEFRVAESLKKFNSVRGAAYGIAAAGLFGASAPLAKLLLPESSPLALASLFYLGAAAVLTLVRAGRRTAEAPLKRADLPLLAAITATGGILGPVLMLVGLSHVSGVAGSLLLNLEAPLTMLVAVVAFGEHLSSRGAFAAGIIVLGGTVLAWGAGGVAAEWLGVTALAAACCCWALDNNMTQRLTLRDPVAVAHVKTIGAGATNLLLAVGAGAVFPSRAGLVVALGVGTLSYGLSIVLDAYALRAVGAAREAAYFATAPFFGALLALLLLSESLQVQELVGGSAMALGVVLLLRERHGHVHTHHALVHEHSHVHDAHHQHSHDARMAVEEPHSHEHVHAPLEHTHPHTSDSHHRHRH
jgi:drug/metabolite transporter (DMT)-like permease